jgi:hypothetical protein
MKRISMFPFHRILILSFFPLIQTKLDNFLTFFSRNFQVKNSDEYGACKLASYCNYNKEPKNSELAWTQSSFLSGPLIIKQ